MLAWMFWLFLFCALSIIIFKGDCAEKRFSIAIAVSVTSTFILNNNFGWVAAHSFVLAVDFALLVVVLILVSKSQRYWPIWFAAFQMIAVATSVAFFVFPNHVPSLYINAQGFWFFPALAAMAVGVIMDNST